VLRGQVCFRSSVRTAVQEVFSARAKLHEFVYTHPVAKAVEYMVTDALLLVAGELGIPGGWAGQGDEQVC
jgi:HD superfamily phosphohydrolase